MLLRTLVIAALGAALVFTAPAAAQQYGFVKFPDDEHTHQDGFDYWWGGAGGGPRGGRPHTARGAAPPLPPPPPPPPHTPPPTGPGARRCPPTTGRTRACRCSARRPEGVGASRSAGR